MLGFGAIGELALGELPSSSNAYTLAGDAGSYTLTGQDATLTYTAGSATQHYTLSGDVGQYVLNGQSAEFKFSGQTQRPVVFINRNVENDPDKVRKVIHQYFDEYEFLHGAIPDKAQIFNAIVMQLHGNESRPQIKKLVNAEISKYFERIAEDEDEESLLMLM